MSSLEGRRAAPALPGLTPTSSPGIFAEDGGADGRLLATRVGRGWLVVQGPSTAIDAMLLGALRAGRVAVSHAAAATGHASVCTELLRRRPLICPAGTLRARRQRRWARVGATYR